MNIRSFSDDIDPFEFCCDLCSKTKLFNEPEIEKIKQKTPGTKNDYFICNYSAIYKIKKYFLIYKH